jgi:hypothetical protein
MKAGRTLQDLAIELDRQAATRKDYVAPTEKLVALVQDDRVVIDGLNGDAFGINDYAHAQIASDLTIPKMYYDRMRTNAPDLLATNVNHWLHREPRRRLVRTLDGNIRGFLSDAYRPLDNFELLATGVMPALRDFSDGARVESAELTEKRLYLKVVFPSVAWDMAMARREAMIAAGLEIHREKPGTDVVQAAVTISNSEVGDGSLQIAAGIFTLACYNLATIERMLRKYHIGRRHRSSDGLEDDVQALLSDESRQADDRAFFLKVRDVVKMTASEDRFRANVEKLVATAGDKITGNVEKVVEATAVRFGLTEDVRASVLQHLAAAGDLTRYGLLNAVTRASQDVKDYDEASTLERVGGQIIELPRTEWNTLGAAA